MDSENDRTMAYSLSTNSKIVLIVVAMGIVAVAALTVYHTSIFMDIKMESVSNSY